MKKSLIILLVTSFCIFLVGFGLRFSADSLVSDIGLWISFCGSFFLAIIALFICVDTLRKKKRQKNFEKEDNSEISNEKGNKK